MVILPWFPVFRFSPRNQCIEYNGIQFGIFFHSMPSELYPIVFNVHFPSFSRCMLGDCHHVQFIHLDTLCWTNIAIENGHRNSEFSHKQWWFSIAMLVYQRVALQQPARQTQVLAGEIPEFWRWKIAWRISGAAVVAFFWCRKRRELSPKKQPGVLEIYHDISYFLIRMNHLCTSASMAQDYLGHFFESDESEICTWIVGLQVRHSRRVSNGKALIALRFSWVVRTHMYGKEVNYNIQPRFIYQHFEIWTTCNCTWNYIFESMMIYVWTYSNISNIYIYKCVYI